MPCSRVAAVAALALPIGTMVFSSNDHYGRYTRITLYLPLPVGKMRRAAPAAFPHSPGNRSGARTARTSSVGAQRSK